MADLPIPRTGLVLGILSGLAVALLVLPALAITTARVLPDGGLLWVILRSFTPIAIILYGPAAILLGVMTWRIHGAARPATAAVLAVVTLLLSVHVWWFVGPFLADSPGSPSTDTLTVMTANLHIGRADPESILQAVDDHGVDVLVLVEITPAALAGLERAGLGQRLGHSAGAALEGRDGIMVFASRPLREVGQIDTSTAGHTVEMTTDRGPLRILAVHPTAPNNGVTQWSSDLDTVVAAARASSGPTLLAGDFNATLDHPQLLDLLHAGYRDAGADAGLSWRPTWPSPGTLRPKGIQLPSLFALDHVFIHGPFDATYARTVVVPGTDHRALVTHVSWTGEGHADEQSTTPGHRSAAIAPGGAS